ncbi:hypothetical protein ACI3L1_06710 [Deinococcus sp. SM5_A1]|uniref:hypothetical protein n=1 Tax=Deinococcus sp. SM5_A1 TaxID=3379094 RepID=UPI00385EDC73
MALVAVNSTTARLAANLTREGRQVLISPLEAFGTILLATDWADLGLFPPAEKVAINTNVTRESIKAQDPSGGPDLLLVEDTTEVTATYDNIPVLTPDETVRALHVGSVPVALTDPALTGGTISPFAPGASIPARMIVIRRHQGGADPLYKVYWHPRVAIQNNGEGDNQNRETLQFRVPVQSYLGTLSAALAPYSAQVGPMGAIFTILASQLDALLDILKAEAAA